MNTSDELAILRRRFAELTTEIDRRKANPANRNRVYTGQVYSGGSFPTTAGRWHLTHPLTIVASETEDATPTLTVDSAVSVPVLVIDGPMAVNDYLIADQIAGYWVAEKGQGSSGGGGGTGVLGCTVCPTPPGTLYMTVTAGCSGIIDACTIVYGATDPVFTTLPTSTYMSTALFTDLTTGDDYYWYMDCQSNVVRIKRAFPSSVFAGGGPFVEATIYFWSMGGAGNTCSPFALTNGSGGGGFPGSCVPEINE